MSEFQQVNFPEMLESMAKRYGISLDEILSEPEPTGDEVEQRRMLEKSNLVRATLLSAGFSDRELEFAQPRKVYDNLSPASQKPFADFWRNFVFIMTSERVPSILLIGINGTGKTTASAAIAKRALEDNLGNVARIGCRRLVEELQDCPNVADHTIADVRILVVDDVDRDYTQMRQAALQDFMNHRWRWSKFKTIITTALSLGEMFQKYPHMSSRLSSGLIFHMKTKDLRQHGNRTL